MNLNFKVSNVHEKRICFLHKGFKIIFSCMCWFQRGKQEIIEYMKLILLFSSNIRVLLKCQYLSRWYESCPKLKHFTQFCYYFQSITLSHADHLNPRSFWFYYFDTHISHYFQNGNYFVKKNVVFQNIIRKNLSKLLQQWKYGNLKKVQGVS